ncbi:MAG: helix-turn-helix transcriptional regulator [Gemmatimonadaceae bacterium]|nr:helix-turn-helix transcriptional regulator [Gemmatimonadaceae bacterium]
MQTVSGIITSVEREWFTLTIARYAPGMVMPLHSHDTCDVGFVLAGSLREETGRECRHAAAGSTVVKPAGVSHRNAFGPDGAVMLGLRFREEDAGRERATGASLRDWRWLESTIVMRSAFRLAGDLILSVDCANTLESSVAELLAALSEEVGATALSSRPRWLIELRERLEEDDDSSVTQIASELELHPVYMARRFRSAFGCSIREYRRRVRVARAVPLLGVAGKVSISSVAHGAGFSDHAHLCRQSRELLGVAPSGIRLLAKRLWSSSLRSCDAQRDFVVHNEVR